MISADDARVHASQVMETNDDSTQPIFDVQKVNLQFDVSASFVAAEVANDVLVLALSTGRLLRFDLNSPSEIDDIDLPKRPVEIGIIRRLFLDPSASHLIISTTFGENYYLHTQSRQPKALARLKGVQIECVAWNPALPTASTREILIGAGDGNVYETYLEPSTEFYRREEKYVKNVYNATDGAIVGLHVDLLSSRPDVRRIILATRRRLLHFAGLIGRQGNEGGGNGSIYTRLFEAETPVIREIAGDIPAHSAFAVSPILSNDTIAESGSQRSYAWLNEQGVLTGALTSTSADPAALGQRMLQESRLFAKAKLPVAQSSSGRPKAIQPAISSITMTQFHVLTYAEGRVVAFNRLDDSIVYDEQVLDPMQSALGLYSDHTKNTYWLFTPAEIYEIVVTDEARSVWKIMLDKGQYDAAQRFAKTSEQRDEVAATTGNHLIKQSKFIEAALVLGRSSKPFEDVALTFIDRGEHDALRTYLQTKLASMPRSSTMQRTMLASWLIELYMAKLNQLDDSISARAEATAIDTATIVHSSGNLPVIRREYQEFVTKYKGELDRRTTYEIVNSHGREEELLHFAQAIEDYSYILEYWVQREQWTEAMTVLRRQTTPEIFYRYSTALMTHTPVELIEVLMRQTNLDPKKLIPALLNYNKILGSSLPLQQNQAVRYLLFCIDRQHVTDPAIHNTLISLFASNPATDEKALLSYLETQSASNEQNYDADFALRLCIAHDRVQSAVHVYCAMSQYASAVDLALKHNELELAADVADKPGNDNILRKKLWLKVAKKVIGQTRGIKSAMDFLKKCELLRIEDLIPFFPDFVVIDDFKEEICAALETYSREIDALKAQMDASTLTASSIKKSISALDSRYAIVEPGERCWKCRLPLLMRQFFVFPCQHSFHADCLGELVLEAVGMTKAKRIRELQREVGRAVVGGRKREGMVRELDAMVAGACVLCSEMAVRTIDEPFITDTDDENEWKV